ncbi:MAG: LysR family transcriptional regulator [Thiolinea sp.]
MDNINISKFDLNLLKTFVVLMEERNVSRAAERLNLSQSATSNALERIRSGFHDRILEREGRTMIPTRTALMLWPKINEALATINSAFNAHNTLQPEVLDTHFTIGISEYSMALYGTTLVDTIRQTAPNVSLSFIMARPGKYTEQLALGKVDMLIASVRDPLPELAQHHLFDEDFIGLMASDHPLSGKTMTLRSFVTYPHMLVSQHGILRGAIDTALEKENLSRKIAMSTPWFESVPDYLAGTHYLLNTGRKLGIKLIQQHAISEYTIPVSVPGFSIFLLWHPRHTCDTQHHWLRELIIETLGTG